MQNYTRMKNYKIQKFPPSRIATMDVCEMGKRKHHVSGLLELDVTKARQDLRSYNRKHSEKVSFNAFLISTISKSLMQYEHVAAYLKGKRRLLIFQDINLSLVVEKVIEGQKVPIPLIIEKAQELSLESITSQISGAKNKALTEKDLVLHRKNSRLDRLYFFLPGFLRRLFWKYLLSHPKQAYKKMGNVAFTSIGMMGRVNGWFVPISVHPVCFGISAVIKKPVVVNNQIEIRDILNLSILFDHDVLDGAPMARFISDLSKNIENGIRP